MRASTNGQEIESPKESLTEKAYREFAISEEEKAGYKAGYYRSFQENLAPGFHRCDCFKCQAEYREALQKAVQSYCLSQPLIRYQAKQTKERETARSISDLQGNVPDVSQVHKGGSEGKATTGIRHRFGCGG